MKLKKLLLEIDKNLGKLSTLCPLTQGEVERLRDEFLIEFIYNSNAIEGNTLPLQETAMVLGGVYRRIPVRIMGAFHEPPQPYLVEPMMSELIVNHANRKAKMHLIEAVALFHLDFEGIHPFINGNGRTGRLLINLELMQNGYPAIDVKFSDRRKYYQAFDEYYRNQNDLSMMEMVAGYVNERLEQYLVVLDQ